MADCAREPPKPPVRDSRAGGTISTSTTSSAPTRGPNSSSERRRRKWHPRRSPGAHVRHGPDQRPARFGQGGEGQGAGGSRGGGGHRRGRGGQRGGCRSGAREPRGRPTASSSTTTAPRRIPATSVVRATRTWARASARLARRGAGAQAGKDKNARRRATRARGPRGRGRRLGDGSNKRPRPRCPARDRRPESSRRSHAVVAEDDGAVAELRRARGVRRCSSRVHGSAPL